MTITMNKSEQMKTDDLISQLANDLAPVQRLAHPARRLISWISVALPISLFCGFWVEGQDLTLAVKRLQDQRALFELGAILLTALLAGYAALSSTQPGRSQRVWALPILPFIVWLSLIGENCWRLFQQIGPAEFSFAPHWVCYPAVAATGFAPALFIAVLIRRGVVISPNMTVAMGTLSASALGAVGLRLFHEPDATVLLFFWQLIATVSFMGIASLASSYIYRRG